MDPVFLFENQVVRREVDNGVKTPAGHFMTCCAVYYTLDTSRTRASSGVVIGKRIVLTAKHAVDMAHISGGPTGVGVMIGDGDVFGGRAGGQTIDVLKVIPGDNGVDLALLVLAQDANAAPVMLGTTADFNAALAPGQGVLLCGFGGTLDSAGNTTDRGRKRNTPPGVPASNPSTLPGESTYRQDSMFVAGGTVVTISGGPWYDGAAGDSGGPAYLSSGTTPVAVVGIDHSDYSVGNPLASFSIYIRVDAYAGWILNAARESGSPLAP